MGIRRPARHSTHGRWRCRSEASRSSRVSAASTSGRAAFSKRACQFGDVIRVAFRLQRLHPIGEACNGLDEHVRVNRFGQVDVKAGLSRLLAILVTGK